MLPLLAKTRLLLLDDDPAMQRLMTVLLRRGGHRLDVVSEAAQAIERISRFHYDVLLLDLMTPTEGGMTVIRHLKANKRELLQRVVVVTGSPDTLLNAVRGDVAAIVRKPFDAKELLETVQRVAGK